MYKKKSIKDMDVSGKRVFVRVDFNVPLNSKGQVTNDNKITQTLPTINYLLEQNAKIILCSHLGRPDGKVVAEYSLKPVAERLRKILKRPILMSADVIGTETHKLVKGMQPGDIVLMENVRFEAGEEENDPVFARKLSSIADIYCSDAFGTVHRAHASTAGIAKYLPSCAGLLISRELEILGSLLTTPKRPFVVVLGGAKVKDKIGMISNLINMADVILLGGAMAYTFVKAKGFAVGKSMIEPDKIELARLLLEKADNAGVKILLPVDNVVAQEFSFAADSRIVRTGAIAPSEMGLDIGPKTAELYAKQIQKAKTVLWNGPMGVFEFQKFASGTNSIAFSMAKCKGVTVVAGGDSSAAISNNKLDNEITHISTGGGATLQLLEGDKLPGIDVLADNI
ncbi:MAG: phosphoglycerate kinase [Firmicutes bacterium]|nr:phosphoglycerate kinase [Bacillota bacterium]